MLYHVSNPSISQSLNLSIFQSLNLSIFQSFNLSILQSFNLSIFQSFNLSIFQSLHPSISQSFNPSILLSFYPISKTKVKLPTIPFSFPSSNFKFNLQQLTISTFAPEVSGFAPDYYRDCEKN